MSWQDLVLALLQVLTIVALVPSVMGNNKPEKSTSLFTAFVLGTMVIVYLTMGLTLVASTATVSALIWSVLYFQKK